jgi:hypothetical protein
MLRTQTANLAPDQQQQLHPDFLANEQAYLQMRGSLLRSHPGQWVAIENGQVVAAGDNLLAVTDAAAAHGGHPYIAFVGAEDKVVFRVRRTEFAYDHNYQPTPLPRTPGLFEAE